MWSAKSSYADSEAAHFATFHVPHDHKESFFATNKVVAAASGCKISYVDKGGDLKLKLVGSHRERRIAAVYLFFRLCYDKPRRSFVGFDASLLRNISPPIAHVVRVPDQYNHAVVKESLHARNNGRIAIFDRCSEFGCLIDLTRLDKEREITILSARKVQRDKMLTWITEVAESTMRRRTAPLVALGQAAPVAPAPSPAENATVRALVTMGYDAGRVLRAVASLSDKSNVEAAVVEVERIAGDAVESLMAAVGSKPDYKSELNQLAMATRRKVHYSTMPLADGSGHAVFLSTVIVAPEGSVSAAGKAAGKTLAEQAAARQALVELEKKLSISAARRDEPPDAFVCPITFEVMIDPVIASDGYTYERHAIVHWVHNKRKKTSPTTNADLESFGLIPNYNLRSQISEWQQGKRA